VVLRQFVQETKDRLTEMLPNFLIIGAARCGTSTLYTYLQSHPQIYLRPNKRPEPHFFFKDDEYLKGIDYYLRSYFPVSGVWRAIGEASTSYIFGSAVPARIFRHLPDVRLVVMLRNPIDRAFSNYWHSVRSGLEKLDFATAIERERVRNLEIEGTGLAAIMPYSYVARGFYHAQLNNFLSVFKHAQLLVLIFDDFRQRPDQVLQRVYEFLRVDHDWRPSRLDVVENRSVPEGASMNLATRNQLAGIFKDDVTQLSRLLGRDLTFWLE
jgi:hypothetical protein